MNVLRNRRRPWIQTAVILLGAAIYLPYLLGGGFVCDDWAVWARAHEHPGFWATYRSWFPVFSNRPLAPLLLAATANLLGDWRTGYLLTSLTAYGAAVGLTAVVLRRRAGPGPALVFTLLALCPTICSTLVFSPAMQLLGTSTLLLWALSLAWLDRSLSVGGGWGWRWASQGAVLVALLTYEVFSPLLLLNLALPLLFDPQRSTPRRARRIRYLAHHLVPLVAIVLAVVVLQKLLMPALMPVHSRLNNVAGWPALRSLVYWAFALAVQFPVLLADGLRRFDGLSIGGLAIVALAAGSLWFGLPPRDNQDPGRADPAVLRRLLAVAAASLAATSLLYVLSGSYAAVYGYANRVLSSAWWALALLAAFSAGLWGHRPGCRLALAALIVLNTHSFLLQRNNYLVSASLQQQIAQRLVALADRENVPRGVTVLADVPAVPPENYNDECVFTQPWDLVNAVRYHGRDRLRDVIPVSPAMVRKGRVVVDATGVTVDDQWRGRLGELWWFTYGEDHSATLVPVRDAAHLAARVNAVGRAEFRDSAAARLTERAAAWGRSFRPTQGPAQN